MSERLTQYFEVGNYTEKQNIIDVSDKLPLFENGVIMGKAIDKLAEFEDFMEEQDFESLQLLKATLKMKTQSIKGFEKLCQENQALKDRWDKLKEWAKNSTEVLLYSIDDKPAKLGNKKYNYFERKQVLNKIQELEQEKL